MNVLAVDCSTSMLSVALSCAGGETAWSSNAGSGHTERIMDAIESCMTAAQMTRRDLGLLACALGPGSFTGLRIGMSAVRGLAVALDIPWVAVPTLDCHAWGLGIFPGSVVPVIDGRKGRVYTAIYTAGRRCSSWMDIAPEELASRLDAYPEVLFCGPDAGLMEEYCSLRSGFRLWERSGEPAARAMTRLALEVYKETGPAAQDIGPLYLREPETGEIPPPARLASPA
jgi:tRNA threonylcarbamoyladenosine biosynthesis protein TsaB